MPSFLNKRKKTDLFDLRKVSKIILGESDSNVIDLRRNKFLIYKKTAFIGVSILVGLIIIVLANKIFTHAEVADFSPQTCLGNWENPEKARGESESIKNSTILLNQENSAVFKNKNEQIFCGQFLPENFNKQGTIISAGLTLVWTAENLEEATSVFNDQIETTTENNPTNQEKKSDEILEKTEKLPESQPTSWKIPLTSYVFAQEVSKEVIEPKPTEVIQEPNPAPSESLIQIPVKSEEKPDELDQPNDPIVIPAIIAPLEPVVEGEALKEKLENPPPLVEEEISLPEYTPRELDNNFLEIRYSLDGTDWLSLGKVNTLNFQNLTIPLPKLNWEDLSKIQISIIGIDNNLDKLPKVYLDGMFVEINYEIPSIINPENKKSTENTKVITNVILPNGVQVITLPEDKDLLPVREGGTYGSNENPSFDLDLDALPAPPPTETPTKEEPNQKITPTEDNPPENSEILNAPLSARPSVQKQLWQLVRDGRGLFDFFKIKKVTAQTGEGELLTVDNPVAVQIFDPKNKVVGFHPTILTVNNRLRVSIAEPERTFRPGKYKMKIWILKNGTIYTTESNFSWGVLAVNSNKSIFNLSDTAELHFGVLDDSGHTICDAEINLTITTPAGLKIFRNTSDNSIEKSDSCGPNSGGNSVPDYKTSISNLSEIGIYRLVVDAQTKNGPRSIEDQFSVENPPRFDVERIAPTRTYPPDKYIVTLKIKANEDFDGVVEELVPALFTITDSDEFNVRGNQDNSDTNTIRWNLDLNPGEVKELKYEFKGPNISPELFKLGALKLKNKDPDVALWEESRQWQIASDSVVNTGSLLAYSDVADVDNVNVRFLTTTSTWSGEATTIDTTAETSLVQHVVVRAAPTRNEYLVGNLKANGRLDITRYNGTSWSSIISIASTTYTQVCNTVFGSCNQSFDIAYEQLSGKALIVYTKDVARATGATAEKLYYITWDGNTSSTESNFDFCFVGGIDCSSLVSPGWVRLVPKGEHLTNNRSNEIMILNISAANDIYAGVWNGSSIISTTTITQRAFSASGRPFDAGWETLSGNAVVVFSSSSATTTTPFSYKKLVNGVWDTTSTVMPAITASRGIWVVMDADPQSDRLAVGLTSSSTATMGWPAIWKATGTAVWNLGTGDTTLEDKAAVGVTVAWERFGSGSSTSTALIIYNDDASADAADFATWTPGGGFSASADIASGWTDDGANRKLIPSPNDDEIMRVGVDSDNDLRTHRWDGGAFTTSGLSAELSTQVASSGDSNTVIWENNGFDFAYKPYSPWSLNWRLYSGTSTAGSPSPALAVENTSATVSGVNGQVRLRFNIAELGGNSQINSRKKLQFTSSTTPDASSTIWTDVGNIGSSTIWRYFDCNAGAATCDDGELITGGTLLSSSTVSGWWTTSNNTAANANMDHASTTVIELEFSIEANNTENNQIYFFRMYDVGQDSPVYRQQTSWPATPCVGNSTCTYPSIYTPAVDTNPSLSATSLNSGNPITLTPNTTTTIAVNFTLTDGSGCADVFTNGNVTTTVYRSGLNFNCSEDPLNCYRVTTTTNNCAGGSSANATATVDIYYFAHPTDTSSSFSGENWVAKVEVRDSSNNQTSSTSSGVELNTLVAIEVGTSSINYGSVNSNSNTGQKNQIAPIKNAGNATSSALVRGTALNFGANSIVTSSQHFATSTFVFGGVEQQLSGTNSTISGITLPAYQKILNSLGTWSATTALPYINAQHGSLAYNGYLYIFGGDTGVGGSNTSTVLYGSINSSTGAISSWSTTTVMPTALSKPALTIYNGRVYSIGGTINGSPTHTSSTTYAPINSDGTIGFWALSVAYNLPNAIGSHSIVAKNGYMYVIGGTPTGSTATATVLYAPINDSNGSIGTWATTTALPVARKNHAAYERNGNIYVFGGGAPSTGTSSVIYAPINSDGTLGSWSTASTPLPLALTTFNSLSNSKDSFYTLGGVSGTTSTDTYFSTLSGNSSFTSWTTSTGVPIESQPAALSDRALVTYNGYSYVSGGAYIDGGEVYWATSSVFYAPTYNNRSNSDVFWGVEVPAGNPTGTYSGTVTFSGSYNP